jgi:hypothetical protein
MNKPRVPLPRNDVKTFSIRHCPSWTIVATKLEGINCEDTYLFADDAYARPKIDQNRKGSSKKG